MAGTISSIGIGVSGLNVSDIITKLVDLEKAPLTALKTQSTLITTRISAYAQIKSLATTLSDLSLQLSLSTTWKAVSTASSDATAVQVSSSGTSIPATGTLGITVQQLAREQSAVSSTLPPTQAVGAGALSIQLGQWNAGATAFTPGTADAVSVSVEATDTLAQVAARINAAGAGVTATVVTDTSGQRLMMRSTATGEAAGFRVQVTETTPDADDLGLSRLAFDPASGAVGMASASNIASVRYGRNALATVNDIPVSSATNTFSDTVAGLSFTVSRETTAAVNLTVATDTAAMKKKVQEFVDTYNALSNFLAENTKYDAENKQATLLQGDSAAVGMQNMLRNLVGSPTPGGVFTRLSDIGVELQATGLLGVNEVKLDKAFATNPDDVGRLFAERGNEEATNGVGVRFKAFASGLLSVTGLIASRTDGLKGDDERNTAAQDKINARATNLEARLRKQYTALDAKMAQLESLNAYVAQQVAQWNKSTG